MAKATASPASDIVEAIHELRREVVNILHSFSPQGLFAGGGGGLLSGLKSVLSLSGGASSLLTSIMGKPQTPLVPSATMQTLTGMAGMAAHNLPSVLPAAGAGAAALGSTPAGWIIALAGAATLATAALAVAPTAIHHFVDSLIESNRGLAEFSGAMAMVLAQSDFKNIMRDMRRGEGLAESVRGLVSANARLKDSTLGLEVGFGNLTNKLAETIANIANMAVESKPGGMALFGLEIGMAVLQQSVDKGLIALETATAVLGMIKENTAKMGEPEPMSDFFNRVAKDGQDARDRNDPRFGRAMGLQ